MAKIMKVIIVLIIFSCAIIPYPIHADENINDIQLTSQEKEYIKSHPTLSISVDASWIPYTFYNESTKQVEGMIPGTFRILCRRAGFKPQFETKYTYMDALNNTRDLKTMVVSGVANDPDMAKKADMNLTKPYLIINYSAVAKKEIKDLYATNASYKVAVCTGSYATMAMKKKMPTYQFIEYKSNEECLSAVKDNKVDIALVASYSVEYYITQYEYRDLHTVLINDFTWGLSFGVNKTVDPIVIDILNKGIDSMSDNERNQLAFDSLNDSTAQSKGFMDIIFDQPLYAIVICVVTVGLIIIIIFLMIMHRRELKNNRILQEKNEAIKKVEKDRMDFFSRMSHDMRTPMNGIMGMTELSKDETDVVTLQHNNEVIASSGKYLLELINDTLDLQRVENKTLELEPEIKNFQSFIDSLTEMVKTNAKAKGIHFEVINKNMNLNQYGRFDALRAKQILTNVMSNAIKFTPSGGKVIFTMESLDQDDHQVHCRFTIRDTGIGMSQEFIQDKIFQPYSQEDSSITTHYGGSGLGLAITKSLVELMNGHIDIQSEKGDGTLVTIDIDVEVVDEDTMHKTLDRQKGIDVSYLKDKHILLCEDHPINAEITKKLLNKVGCHVTIACHGEEGLQLFEKSDVGYYDAILMDIRMPIMDGLHASCQIRQINRQDAKNIPIIAMTANAYDEDKKNSLDAGMNDHLSKPVVPQDMYHILITYIKEYRK